MKKIEGNVYKVPSGEIIMVVHEYGNESMCVILPANEPFSLFPVPIIILKDLKYLGNINTDKTLKLLFK